MHLLDTPLLRQHKFAWLLICPHHLKWFGTFCWVEQKMSICILINWLWQTTTRYCEFHWMPRALTIKLKIFHSQHCSCAACSRLELKKINKQQKKLNTNNFWNSILVCVASRFMYAYRNYYYKAVREGMYKREREGRRARERERYCRVWRHLEKLSKCMHNLFIYDLALKIKQRSNISHTTAAPTATTTTL